MIKKILFLGALIWFMTADLKSQDIHFTSYDFSPLTLNPALAGGFSGSYRIGGIYRDQWRSVAGSGGYKTPTVHIDVPLMRGFREKDWIGVGVGVYSDRSSQYDLVQNKSFQGVSYHLSLDKKQQRILAFGVQNGTGTRKVQGANLRTETAIRSLQSGGSPAYLDDDLIMNTQGGTIVDWVGGVTFSSYQRNQSFIRAGVSVGRITRPNQGFANSTDRKRLKYTAFALCDAPLTGKLFLTPSVMYVRTGVNQQLVAQGKLSYLLDESKGVFLNGGLGFRAGDAIQLLAGMDYKDIKVQLAYDINVSGLSGASNTVGAFEYFRVEDDLVESSDVQINNN